MIEISNLENIQLVFKSIFLFLRHLAGMGLRFDFLVFYIFIILLLIITKQMTSRSVGNHNYSKFLPFAPYLIFLFSMVVRIYIFNQLDNQSVADPEMSAVYRNHFGNYLIFDAVRPPLDSIIKFLFLKVSGNLDYFIVMLFFLNSFAISLLYKTFRLLNKKRNQNIFFIPFFLMFSTAITPFEFWRFGLHHDHLFLFFSIFNIYFFVKLLKDYSFIDLVMLNITSCLFLMFTTTAMYFLYFQLIFFFLLFYKRKIFEGNLFKIFSSICLLPLLVTSLLIFKNGIVRNSWSVSNYSSAPIAITALRLYEYRFDILRSDLNKIGAPEWMLHCMSYNYAPDIKTMKGAPEGLIGECYNSIPYEQLCKTKSIFSGRFNFSYMKDFFSKNKNNEMLKVIVKDDVIACSNPWIHKGTHSQLRTDFFIKYNQIGSYFWKLFKLHYGSFFQIVLTENFNHFLYDGLDGMRIHSITENLANFKFFQNNFFDFIYKLYTAFFGTSFLLLILVSVWKFKSDLYEAFSFFAIYSAPVFCQTFLQSINGTENQRYFIQVTPYLFLFFIVFLSKISEHLDLQK